MPIRHNNFQVKSLRLGGLNVNHRNQVISPLSEIGVDTGVDTYRVMVSTPSVGVDTGVDT